MKKNAIGHMMMRKESAVSFLRRLHVLPKLLCLLSAVIIWLLIVNLMPSSAQPENERQVDQLQSDVTDSLEF